ncbi:MAG: TIR domain-containing protein [Flavobacteriales bacterium]|nr:TIR domain-containing protein [Flavobacteriales bacterium]
MATKRVFVTFAIEDVELKRLFTGQAKHDRTPFEFTDMSVKEPWDEDWKTKCRSRIKGCDGVIALISKNLKNASGARWEIKCAKEEGKPLLGVYIGGAGILDVPDELMGVKKVEWTWADIEAFISSL